MKYNAVQQQLRTRPRKWLVTGAAGFIGSNLVEKLLVLNQQVVGLDNFATGNKSNLEEVRRTVTPAQWGRFRFTNGDIRSLEDCRRACRGTDYVLHQAALGSVPRSIEDPLRSHASNVDGFVNMLVAARDEGVKRFVYASSSSVYGDAPELPKRESKMGRPLSPYALTKLVNELYAEVFARCYGVETIGLRYFNVFGPRQDPNGPYAAVIPKWIAAMLAGEPICIYGDGETSRDFCYVQNAVQANIMAAVARDASAVNRAYNVAVNARTSLNELYAVLTELLMATASNADSPAPLKKLKIQPPQYADFRPGDVRHSQADISSASALLGYEPSHDLRQGLQEALPWYLRSELKSAKPRVAARAQGRDRKQS